MVPAHHARQKEAEMDDEFPPYGNESDLVRIGGLEIENRLDRLVLTATWSEPRPRRPGAGARAARAARARAIATLVVRPRTAGADRGPAGTRGAQPFRLNASGSHGAAAP